MKINSKINKRVNESVAECRRVITEATIELLKKIAEPAQDVAFDNILIMHQRYNSKTTETFLASRIAYMDGRGGDGFYIFRIGERCGSSLFLSLDNLMLIYNEVKKVVKAE